MPTGRGASGAPVPWEWWRPTADPRRRGKKAIPWAPQEKWAKDAQSRGEQLAASFRSEVVAGIQNSSGMLPRSLDGLAAVACEEIVEYRSLEDLETASYCFAEG